MDVVIKDENVRNAQLAQKLTKRLKLSMKEDSTAYAVPMLGARGEMVRISKVSKPQVAQKKSKRKNGDDNVATQETGLGLSFEDIITYETPKERSTAIYLGEGIDSVTGKKEHWFFSQSAAGEFGAVYFSGLQNRSQMITRELKIRKVIQ